MKDLFFTSIALLALFFSQGCEHRQMQITREEERDFQLFSERLRINDTNREIDLLNRIHALGRTLYSYQDQADKIELEVSREESKRDIEAYNKMTREEKEAHDAMPKAHLEKTGNEIDGSAKRHEQYQEAERKLTGKDKTDLTEAAKARFSKYCDCVGSCGTAYQERKADR
jgi:hypothetical protein